MRLQNKTALITGAGSGFGAGIAAKFVAEGARIVVADINLQAAQEVAQKLDGQAEAVQADVADASDIERLRQQVVGKFTQLDILVNNAGVTHLPQAMEEVEEHEFDRIFAVNAKSVYLTAKSFVPLMKQQGSGVILNIASTAGVSPRPRLTWYNSTKGWMITATKSMAVELASSGIRVNAINPVAGETPLLKSFLGEDTPEMRQKFLSTIPLGRFSTPEDIAGAACYLCSDEASLVSGVALEVDGGRCI